MPDEPEVAGLLALMGVFDLVGTTGSGWLTDRWDSRALLAWYYSLRGLSLLFLPFALAGSRNADASESVACATRRLWR